MRVAGVRWTVLTILLIVTPGYLLGLLGLLGDFSVSDIGHLAFGGGAALSGGLCWRFVREGSFLAIFEHEFTHMLWGLLFLKKPRGFRVDRGESGAVRIRGGGNFLITLAPYFSLTLNFLMIPLFFILDPAIEIWFLGIFGAALGYHVSSTIKETHRGQTDLSTYGKVFSFLFLVPANVVSFGVVLAFVVGRGGAVLDFLLSGPAGTWGLVSEIWG